jgi:hypothetical protein
MNSTTCFILSNSSEAEYPENTLTKFINRLPFKLEHKLDESWHMTLDKIGISMDFESSILNKNDTPIMIIGYKLISDENCNSIPNLPDKNGCFKYRENQISLLKQGKMFYPNDFGTYCDFEKLQNIINQITEYMSIIIEPKSLVLLGVFKYNINNDFIKHLAIWLKTFQIKTKISNNQIIFNNNDIHLDLFVFIREDFFINKIFVESIEKNELSENSFSQSVHQTIMSLNGINYKIFTITNHSNILKIKIKNENKLDNQFLPPLIKIKTNLIKQQVFNNTYSQDLAIITPDSNKINSNNFFFYELEKKIFYPLSNTNISNIDITITDKENKQLHLKTGIPTIVQLSFEKMSKYKKSFNMYLTSEPTTTFSTNTSNKFKIHLPKMFTFDPYWKVGLTKIHFRKSFKTFITDQYIKILSIDKTTTTIKITNQKYTKTMLLNILTDEFNKIGFIDFSHNQVTDLINISTKQKCKILLSKQLACILGFETNKEYIILDFHLYMTMSKNAPFPINMNYYIPSYMLIYCSIINPIPVGDSYKNLLAVIDWSTEKKPINEHIEHQIQNVLYHNLLNSHIEEIEFEIRSHAGDLIPFESSNVLLNLNFKNYI